MKIQFIGAIEDVTGSKHLLITDKGTKVLLDCGLLQGRGSDITEENEHLGLNPLDLDAVILSHAHIDHSGNLPNLVKQGYTGKIYCTPATLDVCRILLLDSAHIHESDARYNNKKRRKREEPEIAPLYTVDEAEQCLSQFEAVDFDTDFRINEEISFYLSENGHIIGSAAINITAKEGNKITRVAFTGDIGRYADPLLKPPAIFQQADYIICESTYGDTIHESVENAEKKMLDIVNRTCVEKKGKLIIPAFSLGRTQEVLFVLDKLQNKNLIPTIKVYVDSPLSSKATSVVRKHPESFNDALKAYVKKDPDPFGFPNLIYIEDVDESKALNASDEPCVIISASGMGDAGRVKHHIRNSISDPKNTVLISGYCAPRTIGARLMAGDKEVHIFGDPYEVRADVESILSLSAHADSGEIIRYLSCQNAGTVRGIYLVHGEEETKKIFREKLEAEGYKNVVVPERGLVDLTMD